MSNQDDGPDYKRPNILLFGRGVFFPFFLDIKNPKFFFKFYQNFSLKTTGSDYLFSACFSSVYFFLWHLFGDRNFFQKVKWLFVSIINALYLFFYYLSIFIKNCILKYSCILTKQVFQFFFVSYTIKGSCENLQQMCSVVQQINYCLNVKLA